MKLLDNKYCLYAALRHSFLQQNAALRRYIRRKTTLNGLQNHLLNIFIRFTEETLPF